MKKKILILAPPDSTHTIEWIEFLKKFKNFTIYYISLKKDFKPVEKSYSIKFLFPFYKLNLLYSFFKIKWITLRIKPDLIHSHYLFPYGFFTLTHKCKKIISLWGSDITNDYKISDPLMKLLARVSLKNADFITFAGKHLKNYLPFEIKKSDELIWGVDKNLIDRIKPFDRKEIGISENDFLILNLRYIRDIFQIERVIRTVELLNSKYKDIKLVLIKGDDSEYFRKMEKMVEKTNFIKIIQNLSKEKFISLIKSSNLTLSLSLRDGSPVSVKEAMMCKKCVIYQDNDSMRDFQIFKIEEIILKTDSLNELYEKILNLHDDRNLLKKIEQANYVIAEKNFEKNSCFMKGLKIYESLLQEKLT